MKRNTWFTSLCLVIATFGVSQATVRKYSGAEVQNLIDTVNAHSAVMVQTQANISTICHKLDSDAGVTDTTYFSAISPITTAANTLRR